MSAGAPETASTGAPRLQPTEPADVVVRLTATARVRAPEAWAEAKPWAALKGR